MSHNGDMRDRLTDALKRFQGGYAEIRAEKSRPTRGV